MNYTNLNSKILRILLSLTIYPCVIIAGETPERDNKLIANKLIYNCENNAKKIAKIINNDKYSGVLSDKMNQTCILKEELKEELKRELSNITNNCSKTPQTDDLYPGNKESFSLGKLENSTDNSDFCTVIDFDITINPNIISEEEKMNYAGMYSLYQYMENKDVLVFDSDNLFLKLIKIFKSEDSTYKIDLAENLKTIKDEYYCQIRKIINEQNEYTLQKDSGQSDFRW